MSHIFSKSKALSLLLLAILSSWQLSFAQEPSDEQISSQSIDQTIAKDSGQDSISTRHFLKVLREPSNGGKSIALQTAIKTYCIPNDRSECIFVDLIAAVHIGDPKYYQMLNKEFEKYDALLFELVAPEGNAIPVSHSAGNNSISALQMGLKQLLELEFQLDKVDYSKTNFVHADLSPATLFELFRKQEGGIGAIVFQILMLSYAKEQAHKDGSQDLELLAALLSPKRALALKRILAKEFESSADIELLLRGPLGHTLVGARNRAALEVLATELKAKKKTIGIFYGAAHMEDMERQLKENFHARLENTRWLEAWDLRN
ncbi:MAG: hypothetical protein IT291_01455 [Deltaproteobacteria bacterium]|nr:hypothetical protein [Deltaproteobacteria bacterium]